MTRNRYRIFDNQYPHFLTATINNWLPIFTRPETVKIIFNSWEFLQEDCNFKLYGYVILENHLHMVASSDDLNRDIKRFKAYTAKKILFYLHSIRVNRLLWLLKHFKRPHKNDTIYQVWEEGSHPQIIENVKVLEQKLEYIHQNPVKRGYVDLPEHWRYSSARNYAGLEGLIEVCTEW